MLKLDKLYNTCKFFTLTIDFSRNVTQDLGKQLNLMIRFENVLKTSLQDVLRTFLRRLEDVLKTFLQDVLNTAWKRLEDVWARWIHWSWARHLQHVFWRRRWKTSSRCLHQDECFLGFYNDCYIWAFSVK